MTMAPVAKHLTLRDARDRLIDLLALGETHPLRDLPVQVERLRVPAGADAKIPIDASQRDCTYSLWERESETQATRVVEGTPVPAAAPGTGQTLLLESPPIDADIGYRIRSTRQTTGRWVYLHDLAEVKIGLDTRGRARVVSGTWLVEGAPQHEETDPRIVDHGTSAVVEVRDTQVGVNYHLEREIPGGWEEISQATLPGNFDILELATQPLTKDTLLRVVATSVTVPGEQSPLDVTLRVVVRPSTELAVSTAPSHIVDDHGTTSVVIEGSQLGVHYELYARPIPRDEFLEDAVVDPAWIPVAGEDGRVFRAKRPPHAQAWSAPAGFVAITAPAQGNGGPLSIPTGPLDDDCVILVRASQDCDLGSGQQMVIAVPLQQAAAVLVRPKEAPSLAYKVYMTETGTDGAVRLTGGQRGVFYHLRTAPEGADLGRAGYFYERHGHSPELNVGIGKLVVGTDAVIACDPGKHRPPEPEPADATARATQPPAAPLVQTGPVASGTTLFGVARKSRTGLQKPLTHSALIPQPPAITALASGPSEPATGVLVQASRTEETYSLLVNGAPEGQAQTGNGQDLTLPIAQPAAGAVLEVIVRRGQPPQIVVEQVVGVAAAE